MGDNTQVAPSTASPENDDAFDSSIGETVAAMALSAWVVLANAFLIFSILRSEHRRKVSFNLHVVNLCLVGVLLGGLVLTLYADLHLQGHWAHGDTLCRAWLVADMVVGVASVTAIFTAIFDRFLLFSCPASLSSAGCKFVLTAFLVLLPWAVACGLVVPLYLHGETGEGVGEIIVPHGSDSPAAGNSDGNVAYQEARLYAGRGGIESILDDSNNVAVVAPDSAKEADTGAAVSADNSDRKTHGYCYIHLKKPHAVSIELIGYAVPALAAVGLLVATSLTWCVRRHELREELAHTMERGGKGWQLLVCWLVCLAVVGMWFPFSALHVSTQLLDKTWPTDWMTFAIWIAYANAGVNPLLWLLVPSLRQGVGSLLCCCFCCCACCCSCCREKRASYMVRRRRETDDFESGREAFMEFK